MTTTTSTSSGSARVPFVFLLALTILHNPAGLAQAFPYRSLLQTCEPNGTITGKSGKCNTQNDSECCKDGQRYTTFACSPSVTGSTRAMLMLNSFAQGGDGGGAAACTSRFYNDSQKVAALSTGWFDGGSRCEKAIVIRASNGRSVTAMVVDECNSMEGCDEANNYEPPCPNDIVNGSPAVWDALRLNKDDGQVQITWSDAKWQCPRWHYPKPKQQHPKWQCPKRKWDQRKPKQTQQQQQAPNNINCGTRGDHILFNLSYFHLCLEEDKTEIKAKENSFLPNLLR